MCHSGERSRRRPQTELALSLTKLKAPRSNRLQLLFAQPAAVVDWTLVDAPVQTEVAVVVVAGQAPRRMEHVQLPLRSHRALLQFPNLLPQMRDGILKMNLHPQILQSQPSLRLV